MEPVRFNKVFGIGFGREGSFKANLPAADADDPFVLEFTAQGGRREIIRWGTGGSLMGSFMDGTICLQLEDMQGEVLAYEEERMSMRQSETEDFPEVTFASGGTWVPNGPVTEAAQYLGDSQIVIGNNYRLKVWRKEGKVGGSGQERGIVLEYQCLPNKGHYKAPEPVPAAGAEGVVSVLINGVEYVPKG